MHSKNTTPKCALLIMTDGLEETETIGILCRLRQTGLCIKSVGLTSGLVTGAHGILLKPDLTLADFESSTLDVRAIKMVILMESNQGMARLETEPRLHHLLLHTLLQGGCVAVEQDGQRIMKAMDIPADQLKTYRDNRQIFIHDRRQSLDIYAGELIRCIEGLPQTHNNRKFVRKLSA